MSSHSIALLGNPRYPGSENETTRGDAQRIADQYENAQRKENEIIL